LGSGYFSYFAREAEVDKLRDHRLIFGGGQRAFVSGFPRVFSSAFFSTFDSAASRDFSGILQPTSWSAHKRTQSAT
jgi:hypothetical protein